MSDLKENLQNLLGSELPVETFKPEIVPPVFVSYGQLRTKP